MIIDKIIEILQEYIQLFSICLLLCLLYYVGILIIKMVEYALLVYL